MNHYRVGVGREGFFKVPVFWVERRMNFLSNLLGFDVWRRVDDTRTNNRLWAEEKVRELANQFSDTIR